MVSYLRIDHHQHNHDCIQGDATEAGTILKAVLLVSAGGVLGSLSRFLLLDFFDSYRLATSAANIIGAALAAHLLILMERRGITELRWFLIPGFCGGLTTFSGVTYEAMLHPHENWIFLSINVIFSLAAVAISINLSRRWIKEKA